MAETAAWIPLDGNRNDESHRKIDTERAIVEGKLFEQLEPPKG